MNLWIIEKPILHISEGTSSIFHKYFEVLKFWESLKSIVGVKQEILSESSAEVRMTEKSKHESCKSDVVDGFVYRTWHRRETLRGASEPSDTITEGKGNWGTKKKTRRKQKKSTLVFVRIKRQDQKMKKMGLI